MNPDETGTVWNDWFRGMCKNRSARGRRWRSMMKRRGYCTRCGEKNDRVKDGFAVCSACIRTIGQVKRD